MILTLIYFILFVFLCACVYVRYCYAGRLMAKIPGPKRLPLFGNMLDMYQTPENLFKCVRQWSKQYGKIWQLSGAHIRSIHVSDPEDLQSKSHVKLVQLTDTLASVALVYNRIINRVFGMPIKKLTADSDSKFRMRSNRITPKFEISKIIFSSTRHIEKDFPYNKLYKWLNQGLLVSNGAKWQHRRKMLTPAFHFGILNKFLLTFSDHTQDLISIIEKQGINEKIDLIPLINKTTLRVMCETSMGTAIRKDTASVESYIKAVHKFGECITERLSTPWYYIDYLYNLSPISKKENSVLPVLHKFTDEMIQNRRRSRNTSSTDDSFSTKSRPALLDLLLEEEAKGRIDNIKEEIDTFLFEGYDTTASALTFMIMRIANEPFIQNCIVEELKEIFGNTQRQPTVEDLSRMKYLDCCIKESLRLYPSVPFVSRFLSEETMLAGYRIPKNTLCDIHIFDIHRNPDVYPDPEKFLPERFLPENAAKRHPYSYIPFSAGPRNCIGQKFATMEVKIVMSGLLRNYVLEPVTRPEDLVFSCDLTLRTNHPIYVRFRNRNN